MTRYRMPSCAPTLRARPPNCSDQVQRDSEAPGKLRTTVPNPDTILAGQSGSPDHQVLLKPGNPRPPPLVHTPLRRPSLTAPTAAQMLFPPRKSDPAHPSTSPMHAGITSLPPCMSFLMHTLISPCLPRRHRGIIRGQQVVPLLQSALIRFVTHGDPKRP